MFLSNMLTHRPWLAAAFVTACLTGVLLSSKGWIIAAVGGWDTACAVYVGGVLITFCRYSHHDALKRSATFEDQSRLAILVLLSAASFVSLIAIATLLSNVKNLPPLQAHLHLAAGALTVFASWMMMHIVFAVHYAHKYFGDANTDPAIYTPLGGLAFPGNEEPLFSDFVYYSLVVGMTCQVSDVQITDRKLRQLTTMHGLVSFFFNTIVVAFSVNIAAGMIS
jgi:uncharacterized membrane protein